MHDVVVCLLSVAMRSFHVASVFRIHPLEDPVPGYVGIPFACTNCFEQSPFRAH